MTATPKYLALSWSPERPLVRLAELTGMLCAHAPALTARINRRGLHLVVDGQLQIEERPDMILVGDLIEDTVPAGREQLGRSAHRTASDAAAAISRSVWGGFVAFLRDARTGTWHLYRDPSGHMPAQLVRAGVIVGIGDTLPRWLLIALGAVPTINRDALADALAHPSMATYSSLLDNVMLLPAGMTADCSGELCTAEVTWRPWPPRAPVTSVEAAEQRLRDVVGHVVERWSSRFDGVALELSGGLDSAIVLGGLTRSRPRPALTCVNFATQYPGGNERRYARDAADHAGVTLIELDADEREMNFQTILNGAQSVEPILYGLDPILEQTMPSLFDASGAGAIMTGQGGDAVFFHSPTPLVAVDRRRAGRPLAGLGTVAMDAAYRARCSIWRVGALLARDLIAGSARPDEHYPAVLLADDVAASRRRDRFVHPWLRDLRDVPPAKYAQLAALANGQLFSGPTRRREHAPLIHPLLAQPVVEAAIAIPTWLLASGMGNRALARRAFENWLPPSILHRQGKGEAGTYYGRGIAANLDYFRALLLDGVLAREGLVDRRKVEATLCTETLLWKDHARQIAVCASFEMWARHWQC